MAKEIDAVGYSEAGFVNITTSDGVVHGQVRQSDTFSFARIYESGHEVPFYQPVVALEMLQRALGRKDIATGKEDITASGGKYKTVGPSTSDYREGNGTMVFEVLPTNSTYNTELNGPDPKPTHAVQSLVKREVGNKAVDTNRRGLSGIFGGLLKSRGGQAGSLSLP